MHQLLVELSNRTITPKSLTLKDKSKKVVDRAQEGAETVYLAPLYLQTTIQAVWASCGQTPQVRSDAQRTKVNFYGTLNLPTGKEIVVRTPEMNGPTSVQHLEQILAAFPTQHIVLFWDRASWHKGRVVNPILASSPTHRSALFPGSFSGTEPTRACLEGYPACGKS